MPPAGGDGDRGTSRGIILHRLTLMTATPGLRRGTRRPPPRRSLPNALWNATLRTPFREGPGKQAVNSASDNLQHRQALAMAC